MGLDIRSELTRSTFNEGVLMSFINYGIVLLHFSPQKWRDGRATKRQVNPVSEKHE